MPFLRGRTYLQGNLSWRIPLTFKLPSLLYKSALIQWEIDAEQTRPRPDQLRLMRLKALRLKLMERLYALEHYAAMHGLRHNGMSYAN
jgi:hypothetical protein